jgi:NAD(P)-dependent dehydrogenase (short-subunit alcohol dehydrogenase family)
LNDECLRLFAPNVEHPTKEDVRAPFASMNVLPIPWMEPRDVSNTIVWLVSDDARFVTGAAIPIDMGLSTKYPTALAE